MSRFIVITQCWYNSGISKYVPHKFTTSVNLENILYIDEPEIKGNPFVITILGGEKLKTLDFVPGAILIAEDR